MKVSWKKKRRWKRPLDAIASEVRGRELTVNGKAIKAKQFARPAVGAVGGLVIATAISAFISTLREQG
jgi:hypothetical protein